MLLAFVNSRDGFYWESWSIFLQPSVIRRKTLNSEAAAGRVAECAAKKTQGPTLAYMQQQDIW